MKICFIAGADSIHSKKWVEFFVQRGHKVFWISLIPPLQGVIKNVNFYEMRGNFWRNIFRVKKLINEISPDIVHAHYAGKNGFLGAYSNFHPFVLTVWGDDVLFLPHSKIKGPLVRFAIRKADLITCDAHHMKDVLIKLGVPQSLIRIVYFGIDTNKFSPGEKDIDLVNSLGLSEYNTVISLRNFDPIYDLETLIKAAPLILKDVPNTKFIIIGHGPQEKMLKNLATSLKVSSSVKFIGRVPNEEIPGYLRISDVYVSTSLSDAGIAASTAEAMACEVPVVITNSGENDKWINDGENGFLVPVKNPQKLAEKVVYLLNHPEVRQTFGKRARRLIVENNSYYKEMSKMEKIYSELLLRKSA
ncbi:MAG: hypothetical protein DRP76_00210 [Candidatus Omnitrophota bacterium]|nr:MAG: hypothetical protein DRP76_00210 [Candidatus Omnitrophota bacterium]